MTGQIEKPEGESRVSRIGVMVLGLALAVVVAAVAWRSIGDGAADESSVAASDQPPSIDELQRRAKESPDDPLVWQELAFARFERDEYSLAAEAYARATRLDGEKAILWSALGEALVMASERDPMPPEALAAFERAVRIDSMDPRARYFLAVKKDLDGDHQGAIAEWLRLLADTPPGAPWESDLARTIEQAGRINSIETAARISEADKSRRERFATPIGAGSRFSANEGIPGPSVAQIEAARGIPPSEQRQMAEGMVASLEAKLAANPANIDGWLMLMRSRMTLGQPDRAKKALTDAVAANPDAAQRLRSEAEALGIP